MFWYDYLGVNSLKEGKVKDIFLSQYILKDGILRQKDIYSKSQAMTKRAFGFKWSKTNSYGSESGKRFMHRWLLERYAEGDPKILEQFIKPGTKFLDSGCGSGYTAMLLFDKYLNKINYLGVDISIAVDIAKKRFEKKGLKGEFIQGNIINLPFNKPIFDVIYSEGVMHHTDSTEKTFKYLSKLLKKDGRFLFYIYKKKGPIREFADDYIRHCLKDLTDKEAWNALMTLTKLGKKLGELNVKINIEEDIPFLKIAKGKVNIQRFFYWNIFKAFYRKEFSLQEMNHINFDWYRPLNCHRHSVDEIKKWCKDCGLRIERLKIEESGITGVVIKKTV